MPGGTLAAISAMSGSGITPGPLGISDTRPIAAAPCAIGEPRLLDAGDAADLDRGAATAPRSQRFAYWSAPMKCRET